MEKIYVSSLKEDSYMNCSLFLDRNYLLLPPELAVTGELKERLVKWGFISIESKAPDAIKLDNQSDTKEESSQATNDSPEKIEKRLEVVEFSKGCYRFIKTVFQRFEEREILKISEVNDKVKSMLELLRSNSEVLPWLSGNKGIEAKNYEWSRSVETTFLSLILADALQLSFHKQIEVGIASMLHRIGMVRMPESQKGSTRVLTQEERRNLLAYPVIGFRALKEADFPMNIASAVLEHQERENGSGYPRGLSGDKLSIYGKIIAVANSYTAAISERSYKSVLDGHSAIMELLRNSGNTYDQKVVRALVFTLSLYPVGTYVEMSDGCRGIVVKSDPADPKRPTVRLLVNPEGERYAKAVFSMQSGDDGVGIARPLTDEERSAILASFSTE